MCSTKGGMGGTSNPGSMGSMSPSMAPIGGCDGPSRNDVRSRSRSRGKDGKDEKEDKE